MFKLVVLSALLALAVAAPTPGHLYSHHAAALPVVHAAPVISSAVVGSVPKVVSHQSTTIVHHEPVVASVVHSVPVVHAAPVVRTVPVVHSLPVAHYSAVAAHPTHVAYGHQAW